MFHKFIILLVKKYWYLVDWNETFSCLKSWPRVNFPMNVNCISYLNVSYYCCFDAVLVYTRLKCKLKCLSVLCIHFTRLLSHHLATVSQLLHDFCEFAFYHLVSGLSDKLTGYSVPACAACDHLPDRQIKEITSHWESESQTSEMETFH